MPQINFKLIICIFIASCLAFYLYLNIQVYNDNNNNKYIGSKPLSRRRPILDHEAAFADSGTSLVSVNDLFAHCLVALELAGNEVVLANSKSSYKLASKGKTREGVDDVVTDVDIKSSKLITNVIKDSYKRVKVLSEEDNTQEIDELSYANHNLLPIDRQQFAQLLAKRKQEVDGANTQSLLVPQNELLIWIDPLDATKEYSENLTQYVTLMGCIVHKQKPIANIIYKPFIKKTYWSFNTYPNGGVRLSKELEESLRLREYRAPENNKHLRIIVSRSHAHDIKEYVSNIDGKQSIVITAGGSGYKTIELLSNSVDAYVHKTIIKKWDICAPAGILQSVDGGSMTDMQGKQIDFGDYKNPIVESGLISTMDPKLHVKLKKLLHNAVVG